MDWDLAIERNRVALHRILAMLVAMVRRGAESQRFGFPSERTVSPRWPFGAIGRSSGPFDGVERPEGQMAIAEGWACSTLPRHLHRAILRLLRPAESATRRLIIIVARGIAATPRARRPAAIVERKTRSPYPLRVRGRVPATGPRPLTLPLFDQIPRPMPRRPTPRAVPRICVPGFTARFPVAVRRPPMPDDPIDAARLNRRLSALASALDDLPAHARRFARWRAARDAAAAARDQKQHDRGSNPRIAGRIWPLRPGQPPGRHRVRGRRQAHEVHGVLSEVHELALWALERPNLYPDTS